MSLSLGELRAEPAPPPPGFKLITHPSTLSRQVARSFLARVFLGKAVRWPDGEVIHPVDQPVGNAVREAFSRDVLARPATAVQSYWLQNIFSGRNIPPPEVQTDQEVIEYVLARPRSVGYVSADADVSKVKVLRVE